MHFVEKIKTVLHNILNLKVLFKDPVRPNEDHNSLTITLSQLSWTLKTQVLLGLGLLCLDLHQLEHEHQTFLFFTYTRFD